MYHMYQMYDIAYFTSYQVMCAHLKIMFNNCFPNLSLQNIRSQSRVKTILHYNTTLQYQTNQTDLLIYTKDDFSGSKQGVSDFL